MKFKCNFGKGVRCKVLISEKFPEKGSSHIRKMEWTGNPKLIKDIQDRYVKWIHTVNQTCVEKWGKGFAYVVISSPTKHTIFEYQPGEAHREIDMDQLEAAMKKANQ